MDFAFDFVQSHGGIEYEDDYPYKGGGEQTLCGGRRQLCVV
jgi:hypothetical protein